MNKKTHTEKEKKSSVLQGEQCNEKRKKNYKY